MREVAEVELGARRHVHRHAAVLVDAFEIGEEVQLVPDDRTADVAPELDLLGRGLCEILLFRKIILRRHVCTGVEVEQHAAKRVGAGLRHRVDDAAGGGAELRVELAGQDLELLDRFDRGPCLGAAVAAVKVSCAGAVERVVDVLVPAVDADRIAPERFGRVNAVSRPRAQVVVKLLLITGGS